MESQLQYYSFGFSCYISEQKDGTWACITPISGEHGFKSSHEAEEYSTSYGRIDSRKSQTKQ